MGSLHPLRIPGQEGLQLPVVRIRSLNQWGRLPGKGSVPWLCPQSPQVLPAQLWDDYPWDPLGGSKYGLLGENSSYKFLRK